MAAAVVGYPGADLTAEGSGVNPAGRSFYKMSGSGNDFVIVDATQEPIGSLAQERSVRAICARATGVGADGLVYLERSSVADYRMVYLNSDGSRADLCGNASLCSARLASQLGIVSSSEFRFETDAGVLGARMTSDGPEVDLRPVQDVRPRLPFRLDAGEQWIGFALAGVPHLTVRVDDVSAVDVVGRGRPLRHDPTFPHGANVNFVGPDPDGSCWRIRTFERGVEGETLACGTGSVATAVLLAEGGEAREEVRLRTRSGLVHRVRLRRSSEGWTPSLSGEARLVFQGTLGEL